jgi:hypothetical protein
VDELLLFYIPLVNQLGVETFNGFMGCWLALACCDQAAQAVFYKMCPGFIANFVALILWNEPLVGKAQLRLFAFFRDLEDHLRVLPLFFVLCEVEVIIQYVPDYFLFGDEFGDPDLAKVNILVVIIVYTVELVGDTVDAFRPPSAWVVDRGEDFTGGLVYQDGSGEILFFHILIFLVNGIVSEIKAIE